LHYKITPALEIFSILWCHKPAGSNEVNGYGKTIDAGSLPMYLFTKSKNYTNDAKSN
jgi:hypothetical protein